jgi:hypothetical protein
MPISAQEPPPQLLLVVQERLRPGSEQACGRVELEIADVCARLGCPNPYLALESVDGPKEVWWLNAFASEADKARVEEAYTRDSRLTSALRTLGQRKESLTEQPRTLLTRHRRDLSSDASWRVSGAHFFVVTLSTAERTAEGVVFESPDGWRLVFAPAATRPEADRMASLAGAGSTIFAVQPLWSLPADTWIAADPEFWESSPAARIRHRESH